MLLLEYCRAIDDVQESEMNIPHTSHLIFNINYQGIFYLACIRIYQWLIKYLGPNTFLICLVCSLRISRSEARFRNQRQTRQNYNVGGKETYVAPKTKYVLPSTSNYSADSAPNSAYRSPIDYTAPNTQYSAPNSDYNSPNSQYSAPNSEYTAPNSQYSAPNSYYTFLCSSSDSAR